MLDSGDGDVTASYSAATGRPVLLSMLDLYRLGWDLVEVALSIALFRAPHTETEDARKSLTNLNVSFTHLARAVSG
jgi:hypothetical protein